VPQTPWVVEGLWRPDSVREGKLELTIEEVSAKTVQMRVHGSVVLVGISGHEFQGLEKRYDASIEGRIDVDRAPKKIVRFDLVALGDYTGEWFTGHERWKAATPELPLTQAFAFEIDRTAYELPPERRRPRGFMHAYVFNEREKFYWDPDLWKEDWEKRGKK
jgi:hypothetical protein